LTERRTGGGAVYGESSRESLLIAWPLDTPADWIDWVNTAQTEAELEALRKCVNRGTPYFSDGWKTLIANALGLESTLVRYYQFTAFPVAPNDICSCLRLC
jgi:hypothetical protein